MPRACLLSGVRAVGDERQPKDSLLGGSDNRANEAAGHGE